MIYVLDPVTKDVDARSHCEVEGLCFLATITCIQTGKRDRAAIVRCAYELQAYLLNAEDVVIEGVQMLCPPALTGRSVWSLEELVEIIFFNGVDIDESAVIYRTSGGTYKLGDLDLRRKKTSRAWFSEAQVRSRLPRTSDRAIELSEQRLYSARR
ncbi:hypothetical protein ALO43_101301 [Pseudomonas tremae]|uniref:Uncharacterized protein n=4 Tax=Pseudomonas TaxID=286 RepID=A0A3M3RA79_PSECA|nr:MULTISPECIES: hypothetical protein [Pseudomonas syringae group]KGS15808.1 hypothetical protein OA77_03830 [Pseudomonas coronafaciens]KKI27563.1 hypothetical protein WX98_03410 [Pseudomonas syringae pv. persicae]KOP55843.1 hypothetical protein OX88_11905 [Pseudomonas coronafaciens pv. porri]KPW17431.1 hypothetical protein ALO83_103474 [Pseudomonas cannabina pv. alisalensis]KPW48594.1 hypothetical protein ALO86_101948 [Pseudomonas syringae pv. berberidis]